MIVCVLWDLLWMTISVYLIRLELKDISESLHTANKAKLIKSILMIIVFIILAGMMCLISAFDISLLVL